MLNLQTTKRFAKDMQRMKKRNKDMTLLFTVIERLRQQQLSFKDKDHALKGEYNGCRECHITSDWVLVYRFLDKNTIELYRTGTHQDIFKKRY